MKFSHVPLQKPNERPPRIAFVAEAPSDEELEKGVPLVGPSGRLFNSLLRTANLRRADYLVTNVFDEKVPDNELANWTVPLAEARSAGLTKDLPPLGDKGWLKREYHWHLARLQAELEEWKPTVIVPLGVTALWALTGITKITQYRGSVIPATRLVPGAKLLPTFHPMAVQHQWKFYSVVVGDLLKAEREAARGPEIIRPKRQLVLEPSLEDIRAYMPRLLASDLLSADIETGWKQITCIGFAPDAENAICIPFIDLRKPNRCYWKTAEEELETWKMVREVMESPVPKLGQNFGAYDTYWLLKAYRIRPINFRHDTRLLHHALYPELPKDLGFLGASYTQQGPWKMWGKKASKAEKRDD